MLKWNYFCSRNCPWAAAFRLCLADFLWLLKRFYLELAARAVRGEVPLFLLAVEAVPALAAGDEPAIPAAAAVVDTVGRVADRAPTYPNSTSPHGVEGNQNKGWKRYWERKPERQRELKTEDIKGRARERERKNGREKEREERAKERGREK